MPKQHAVYAKAFENWKASPGDVYAVNVVDTAKCIRATLKSNFPGTKFSVRSEKYAGGASIDVYWTDGPSQEEVDAVLDTFAGSRFDGMIDMQHSVGAWLYPDGSASLRESQGTEGQKGTHQGFNEGPENDGAIAVRFRSDFVFGNRYTSEVAA